MKVEQLYTKCLAEATYYIMSNGEVAIIDPLRETKPYIEKAEADNAVVKYIFLTHFHADFVSGHVDLAKATGATIVYGPTATAEFNFHEGTDNEIFKIGKLEIKLLHTPGHTLESSSYLLFDELGKEYCLFSGDTLFIGDVGRPDLAVSSTVSKADLAAKLYSSLHDKIMKLPDEIIVYPNHGKGSACGKNMSNDTFDTLGNQKMTNYALNTELSKDDFVKQVLDGLTCPPQYFPKNAQLNKSINVSFDRVMENGLKPLTINQYRKLATENNALLLDVRSASDFTEKHISSSIFIGLDGAFAPWVGALIENINQPIILITPEGREVEAITRLSRIGYDNVLGYIKGGVSAFENTNLEINSIRNIDSNDESLLEKSVLFLDVRNISEFTGNHVLNAIHLPLNLNLLSNTLSKNESYNVYCAGGYRSVIAISILNSLGFKNLINISGGFNKILNSKIPLKNCRKNCPTCECND